MSMLKTLRMQHLYLLTPGLDRKADVSGVAKMVKTKEQLNNVGNNAVPAADTSTYWSCEL